MREQDLRILAMLRTNARQSLTRMSRQSGIPVSTLYDHLKQQEHGAIVRHTVLVDFGKLGFTTRVKLALRVKPDDREAAQAFLMAQPCLNAVVKINNGFDYLVEGVFRDMKEMEAFLDRLDVHVRVTAKQLYYVIEDLKKEAFLTNAALSVKSVNAACHCVSTLRVQKGTVESILQAGA